jgi:hypothetical protein
MALVRRRQIRLNRHQMMSDAQWDAGRTPIPGSSDTSMR